MRRACLLALTLSLLAPLTAQTRPGTPGQAPDPAPAKREDLRRLLHVIGAGENGVRTMKIALEGQRKANPQIPEAFFTAFEAEFTAQRLEDMALPIYDKHLTAAEVKALLAFYATPEGQSFAKKQGLIMEESMLAGQKLGEQVGRDVAARLQAEGKL